MGRIIPAAKPFLKNFLKRANQSEISNILKDNILFFAKRPMTTFQWKSLQKLLRKLPQRQYPGCNSRLFPWAWVMELPDEFDQNLRFLTLLNQMGIFTDQFTLENELAIFPDFCRFYRNWIYNQSLESNITEESFAEEFPMFFRIGFDLHCARSGWINTTPQSFGQNLRAMNQSAIVMALIGPFWEWRHWDKFATAFCMSSNKDDDLFIEPESELSPDELEALRQDYGYYDDQEPEPDQDYESEAESEYDSYYLPDLEEPEDMDRYLGNRYYKYIGGVMTEVDPNDL